MLTDATHNAKTAKTADLVESMILHLAPAKLSGYNVCPFASAGCTAACLNTSGRGIMKTVQEARIRRTVKLFKDRTGFWTELLNDLRRLEKRAARKGKAPVARLNGTSDLPWERMPIPRQALENAFGDMIAPVHMMHSVTVFDVFPNIQFYDYTKIPGRKDLPANYHLTFSLSEANEVTARSELDAGHNVAIVFDNRLPARYWGRTVIDGNTSDLRYKDADNVIVGLTAKGAGKVDATGFVRIAA